MKDDRCTTKKQTHKQHKHSNKGKEMKHEENKLSSKRRRKEQSNE